jgi:DNA-binding FrmR family transcriptional regulator
MTDKQELTARLKRIEGQIRGLQRMIEESRDCRTFMQQLSAARKALDRVGVLAVANRMSECLGLGEGRSRVDAAALEDALKLLEHVG